MQKNKKYNIIILEVIGCILTCIVGMTIGCLLDRLGINTIMLSILMSLIGFSGRTITDLVAYRLTNRKGK